MRMPFSVYQVIKRALRKVVNWIDNYENAIFSMSSDQTSTDKSCITTIINDKHLQIDYSASNPLLILGLLMFYFFNY